MSANLVRVGGGSAAMAGGVLGVIASLMTLVFLVPLLLTRPLSEVSSSGLFILTGLLFVLAWALALGGLLGLYVSQQEAVGGLGAVGFAIALAGTVLFIIVLCLQTFQIPGVSPIANDLVGIAGSGGWFLFGLATFMARIYPRPAATLLMVGAPIHAFIHLAEAEFIVMAAAIAWLGFFLFQGGVSSVEEEPARPR